MKKFIRIAVILIVLAIFGWTLMYLFNKSEEKPVIYSTETPFVTNIIKKSVATGSVLPRQEIEIKPQVSGIIEKLYVKAGDKISKGALIAKVKIIPDMITLNNAESRVEIAKISFTDAETDLKRQKQLFDEGVIAESEFQKTNATFQSAKEELRAAEDNLQLIKEGVTQKMGESSNTLIRSTVAGMVLDVPVKEGNSVIESNTFNNGTTIAFIADMNALIFEGKVDESEVGKIKEGMDLLVTIGAIEGETFNATLEYIAPKGIEENGAIQFAIKAAMEQKDSVFIRAGYSANANIVLDRKDSVMAIKEGLIIFENDSTFVEIETGDQQFEKRHVELGLSDGINVEVKTGLTKEDKIKSKPIEEGVKKYGRG